MVVGKRSFPFCEGLFSGAILVSGRVSVISMDCDHWDAIGAGNYLLLPTPGQGGTDPDLAAVRRMFVQLGQAEELPWRKGG